MLRGLAGIGQIFEHVAPGAKVKVTLARVQGHGCNGKQGEFEIIFDPPVGTKRVQHFVFDNDGGLERSDEASHPNAYPGKLSAKNPNDESYTYTTFKSPDISVGPAMGSWLSICQNICNRTEAKSVTNEYRKEQKHSSEVARAIEVSMELGVKVDSFGVKDTLKSSVEKKIGHEMSESFMRGETNTDMHNYVFSPEEMKALNIYAVWQWVATTKLSDGEQVLIRSNKFTCTPVTEIPAYVPGSSEDMKACRGG